MTPPLADPIPPQAAEPFPATPVAAPAQRRILVVGASQGVGPAVVALLAAEGAQLLPLDPPAGADPVAWFEALDDDAPVDTLVHCPPPVKNKPVFQMTAEELRGVAEAEMVQPALLMQAAARRMAARGFGRIVAFASMSAKTGLHHNVAPYAAAKGGLLAFARVLAAETAAQGVTVNTVATALFDAQAAAMAPEKRGRIVGEIPVGRFGNSREAAHAVRYLLSEEAGYVTGECLNMSGGRFMD